MFPAFLTTVLFSLSAVSGSRTVKVLGGTEANFWRLIFATILLGLYAHSLGPGLTGAAFPIFLASGCIGFGVGDAAFFQTLPRLGSRLSVLMTLCLSSPIAGVIEWAWLGTSLTRAEITCAAVILAGVAVALAPGAHLKLSRRTLTAGLFFGGVAAFCQAYGSVLSRKAFAVAAASGDNLDGIAAAYQRIVGGLAVTTVLLLAVKRRELARGWLSPDPLVTADRGDRWRRIWPWVLLNGMAGPALGVSCYQWALKSTPTGVVMPIVAITPIVIIPFSLYVEGERPTHRSLIGGLIAVGGAVALAICRS